ncbi:hypothetical protein V8E54_008581 [Elaphomyces granulatus]
MTESSKRPALEAARTGLDSTPERNIPPSMIRETTKIEAEERLVKARTQVARAVEAVEEDDLLNDDISGEMSESLNSIRNLFGAIPDKYFKQIYHDKFDPKNIIRLSQPLGTVQESHEDETKLDITANTIRIRRTTYSLKEHGSTTTHWSRAFGVYAAILCSFFALKYPSLPTTILHFG